MNRYVVFLLSWFFLSPVFADSFDKYTLKGKDQEAKGHYYDDVSLHSGYALKSQLSKILSRTHVDRGYSSLIRIYIFSDRDQSYDFDNSIVDMYSEEPNREDPYNFVRDGQRCGNYKGESDCYNREHLFPQSAFSKRYPMRSDFFHIYPTDGYVNNRRSNYSFGEVRKPKWTSSNGSKLGENAFEGRGGRVFEPIDEFKGDIARALFYFATRYENRIQGFHHEFLDGSREQVYRGWFVRLLLKWHRMDPVSDHEVKRNEAGYRYQGNRNPFIDRPEWVEQIWGQAKIRG